MALNKIYYQFGNPFKCTFYKHFCLYCGARVNMRIHKKIVDQNSEEACYYDFSTSDGGAMIGSCEFSHKVFYCHSCGKEMEPVSQLSLESALKTCNKVVNYFNKHGKRCSITFSYELHDDSVVNQFVDLENVKNLLLNIEFDEKKELIRLPRLKKEFWERPYYFEISQKRLRKLISENL